MLKKIGVNKTLTTLLIVFLTVIALVYSLNNDKSDLPTNTYKRGWKLYENHDGKFSIQYPSNLNIRESSEEKSEYYTGEVCFYEDNYKTNCSGGFKIMYVIPSIDGKGGGCDPSSLKPIEVLGKKQDVCIWDTGFNTTLYLSHPSEKIEVWPISREADKKMIDTVIEMMKTFKFNE